VIRERRMTTSYLKNVQSEVVVFQINDKDSKAGGGSCFGDSGGPVLCSSTGTSSGTRRT
jgi:Trypsin